MTPPSLPSADQSSPKAVPSGCRSLGQLGSAAETAREQLLALLSALAALTLGSAEELGELGISVALGILDVPLEAEGVAQARLGEPDDVVVLVLGARDLPGLASAAGHDAPPSRLVLYTNLYPGGQRCNHPRPPLLVSAPRRRVRASLR